jgi:hypothetical protein
MEKAGKLIIVAGAAIIVIGVLIYFLGDKMNWMGRLPGDIRIERENFKFYFPLTTMVLVSILLSLVLWLVRKF